MAVANYMKVKDFEDIREISHSISPVLVNSLVSIGDLTALEGLRQQGADLNAVDNMGRAAIHVVCSVSNNLEVANYLFD